MKPKVFAALLILTGLQFGSCKKKDTKEETTTTPPPTVYTSAPLLGPISIYALNDSNSTCVGEIASVGSSEITATGFCWSETPNPTILSNHKDLGPSNGSFTSTIAGLKPATSYYLRTYATNAVGTSYSNELKIKTFPSWETLPIPSTSLEKLYVGGTLLLASGNYSDELYKSADNGLTWTKISDAMDPAHPQSLKYISDVIVRGTSIFVSCIRGVLRSSDGGSSWTLVESKLPSGIIASPPDGSFFVSSGSSDYFTDSVSYIKTRVSKNNGATWYTSNTGLPPQNYRWFNGFAFINNTLYGLFNKSNLFKSTDGGDSWTEVNLPPTEFNLNYGIYSKGNHLVVSTNSGNYLAQANQLNWKKADPDYGDSGAAMMEVKGTDFYFLGNSQLYISKDTCKSYIRSALKQHLTSGVANDQYVFILGTNGLYRRAIQ